jgi:hypothetical protein
VQTFPRFTIADRDALRTERAADLYTQVVAGQWDPKQAIDWDVSIDPDASVEAAVVQVMTFLVENEEAALVVPARFLGQRHPHFREVQQALAVTVADEARHIEVFTKRATRTGHELALSTVGGRASLQTPPRRAQLRDRLVPPVGDGRGDITVPARDSRTARSRLLTRRIAQLTRNDEARARGVLNGPPPTTRRPGARPPQPARPRGRATPPGAPTPLPASTTTCSTPSSCSPPALLHPDRVESGSRAVQSLQHEMNDARRRRLARLGFTTTEAETLASLHTRNFM